MGKKRPVSDTKQMLGNFWTIRRNTRKTFVCSVYRPIFEIGTSQRQVWTSYPLNQRSWLHIVSNYTKSITGDVGINSTILCILHEFNRGNPDLQWACLFIIPHPSTQWAAVRTCWSSIIDPPQKCSSVHPLRRIDT